MLNFLFILVQTFFDLLNIAVVVYVILSWFRADRNNKAIHLINSLVEPFLDVIRSRLPRTGMIDFSPIILIIAIEVIRQLVFYAFTLLE